MDIFPLVIVSVLQNLVVGQDHTGGWNYDDIETCREAEKKSFWYEKRVGSKYLVRQNSETEFYTSDGVGGGNSNYDFHNNVCKESGLALPTVHNIEDWITLRIIAIETYQFSMQVGYDKRFRPEFYKSIMMETFIVDMKYNADAKKAKPGASSIINPADNDIFVVWGDKAPSTPDDHIRIGLTVSMYPDGETGYSIVAETVPRSYSGHFVAVGFFPVLCMFPEDSKCYELSLEETTIGNNAYHDTLFFLTDAFRGKFYMSSYTKVRKEGEKLCKGSGYKLLEQPLNELPWTTKYLRTDIDKIQEAYSNALRHKLNDTFPYAGFHARQGHEYFFNFTRSHLVDDKILVYAHENPYGEWQLIERELNPNAERYCLCYKES